jgi:hypothetical protein
MVWRYFSNSTSEGASDFAVCATQGEILRLIGSTIPT